jgi:hypothetical protein
MSKSQVYDGEPGSRANIVTTLDAFSDIVAAVTKLERLGVPVTIIPSANTMDFDIAAGDHLPPDKWLRIKLRLETDEHECLVRDAEQRLAWIGVHFDLSTDFKDGRREWKIDKSMCCLEPRD